MKTIRILLLLSSITLPLYSQEDPKEDPNFRKFYSLFTARLMIDRTFSYNDGTSHTLPVPAGDLYVSKNEREIGALGWSAMLVLKEKQNAIAQKQLEATQLQNQLLIQLLGQKASTTAAPATPQPSPLLTTATLVTGVSAPSGSSATATDHKSAK